MLALSILLIACFGVAAINSWFERSSANWFQTLQKPPGVSATEFLGRVWGAAYFLVAVAAWRIWVGTDGWQGAHAALIAFVLQLVLTVIWTAALFGARSLDMGFFTSILLWLAAVDTDFAFWKISPLAGALMFIYVIWITYVVVWNARLRALNRVDEAGR